MSLPTLDESAETVAEAEHDIPVDQAVNQDVDQAIDRTADAVPTFRAVMAISIVGAGCWYLLWKISVLLVMGR